MVTVITHDSFMRHEMGERHPESPRRLESVLGALRDIDRVSVQHSDEVEGASNQVIGRAHSEAMIERLESAPLEAHHHWLDGDTAINCHSLAAARLAAGTALVAVDLALDEHASVFCAVRPPGHHAEYDRSMGFCLFNNVAIAALHALNERGLERVAIVDFDVHHGNGTEDIFKDDPRVLFVSSFQHPFYPGTRLRADRPNLVHLPLERGSGSLEFRDAYSNLGLPALDRFEPQLLLFSAGFDGHRDDPLAEINLEEEDFEWITRQVVAVAKRHSPHGLVSCLEGGYDLVALANSVRRHVAALAEPPG